jgi:signal transduction histidine kinase
MTLTTAVDDERRLAGVRRAARDAERRRLARELHDTVLHGLTTVALHLRALLPRVAQSDDAAARMLEDIVALAEHSASDARRAVCDIRSADAPVADVAPLLETAVRRCAGAAVRVEVSITGLPRRVERAARVASVAIAREATANAIRHARATTLMLSVAYGRRRFRVTVSDDGVGFTGAGNRVEWGRWGLRGMRERARAAGGALRVRSAPGKGTCVDLVLPYRRTRASRRPLALIRRGE